MIKNLVFDFGHVLVEYDYTLLLAKIFDDPVEAKAFYKVFCSPEFSDLCDRGVPSFAAIIEEYKLKYPHWADKLQVFHDRQEEGVYEEVPGMCDLLTRLRNKGFKLYGLTNWSEAVYPVIRKFGILQMLDGTLISSEEHLIKPDSAIYHRFCEKFSLKIEECLFTDDKQINVDGAIAAGMPAVLFKTAAQYEQELSNRTII